MLPHNQAVMISNHSVARRIYDQLVRMISRSTSITRCDDSTFISTSYEEMIDLSLTKLKFSYYKEFDFVGEARFTVVIRDSELVPVFVELLKNPLINVTKEKKPRTR
ncbi:MAG: hypothetical protein [Microviridae sp.]|nr:MAG: hypothetical protein [Microviridae sp.]